MGLCQCKESSQNAAESTVDACEADPSKRPPWMGIGGPSNHDVGPVQWGLSLRQWVHFVDACHASSVWQACMAKYNEVSKEKDYVNIYDINHHFVEPWTRGTGRSVALMMNAETDGGARADLMVSHAWAGDILQTRKALLSWTDANEVPTATVIWFCIFSLYQCGSETGDCGPTIQVQLEQGPFEAVIKRARQTWGMIVVHTSACEIYDRLWCVHEVDLALEGNVPIGAVMSLEASESMLKSPDKKVDTSLASCVSKTDEEMIQTRVQGNGGFERLDRSIHSFRLSSILQQAVAAGDLNACKILLHEAADPNVQDTRGRTCLHISAKTQYLSISKLLIAAEAELLKTDATGGCPAHSLSLSLSLAPSSDLIEHFQTLAPGPQVLAFKNAAGVKVAIQFAAWARTAAMPDGSPCEPAQKALEQLVLAIPLDNSRFSIRKECVSFDAFWESTGEVHHRILEVAVDSWRVPVHTWENKLGVEVDLVLVCQYMTPGDLYLEKIDKLMRHLCSRHALRAFALTSSVQSTPMESAPMLYNDFCNFLLKLVRALPTNGKMVFVDDARGMALPLCWELLPRLAGVMSINGSHLFANSFLESEAWQQLGAFMSKVASRFLGDETTEQIYGPMVASGVTRSPDNDKDIERLFVTAQSEGKKWRFFQNTCMNAEASCACAKVLSDKQPLPPTLPAMIVCGDSAPKVGTQESCQRLRNMWLPSASFSYVEYSKIFWLLEGEAQVAAVATLLDQFLVQCLQTSPT